MKKYFCRNSVVDTWNNLKEKNVSAGSINKIKGMYDMTNFKR